MWARGTKPRKRRRKQKSANGGGGGKMLSNGAIRVDSLLRIRGSSRGRVPGRERPNDPAKKTQYHFKIGMRNVPEGTGCFARQDGVNTHTAWHVFLVNKSFTKHNYIGEGNLIPATEKVSFTPAKHRCVAVTGMATRVEMWALCASASGFSSEVWAVLDLKIVLTWLLRHRIYEISSRKVTPLYCISSPFIFRLVQIVNVGAPITYDTTGPYRQRGPEEKSFGDD
uniref:Uncharacterized protein n=1 Tax=Oryza glumipatula TaxID=40148 RepID=A0A0D9Z5V2_9ORYZ